MTPPPPLVVWHSDCPDGFTAAWIVASKFSDAELYAANYGDPPPDCTGRTVYVVDFSYPRAEMERMADQADLLFVFDHHQSAAEALDGFGKGRANTRVVFDMERSGAGITWDEMYYAGPRPLLVDHVEDRDLWRFALPYTREIMAAVMSRPYDLFAWSALTSGSPDVLVTEGRAIERYRQQQIDHAVSNAREVTVAGHKVLVTNCPRSIGSEAAGELAKGRPFAGYYYDGPDGRRWGLRSTEDGLDVAKIAESFGGGGHKHAAGFTTRLMPALG